jgi:hypothetical protein
MLHRRHIFSKNMQFPEIECYFCMFSYHNEEYGQTPYIYYLFSLDVAVGFFRDHGSDREGRGNRGQYDPYGCGEIQ